MITTRLAFVFTATALLTAQARAQKAPSPPAEDIRCLIVAMQFASSTKTDQKTGGDVLAMYYMGRLDKYPAQAVEDARCGKALMEKGQILTLIGTNLSQRAQQQQSPSKSPEK